MPEQQTLFIQTITSGRPDYVLPDATLSAGRVIVVKVPTGAANTFVVAPLRQLIDGSPDYEVQAGGAAIFQARGPNWYVIASFSLSGGVAHHASTHENGGGDEIDVTGLSGLLADRQDPTNHASRHQNGGADEISVAGLSGLL